MALEIERKYLNVDHSRIRTQLLALGAMRVGVWFEANTVFDDANRGLKAQGTLLRLREKQNRHILTLKEKPQVPTGSALKVYEEHETEIADATVLVSILAGLGLHAVFRYEKIREKWRHKNCALCLDRLPFGDFLEIEGDEPSINDCAKDLQLPEAQASTATYHELNRRNNEALGLPVMETFVFTEQTAQRLRKELALPPLDSSAEGA
jgi:adenylate cyclase class 2